MVLFTVSGEELHDALANVIPHTEVAGTLPVLASVQVTVNDDGLIEFVATDRYTCAVTEAVSDPGTELEPGIFLIPRDVALAIAKTAKAAKRGDVAVTANVGSYTIEVRDLVGQSSMSARLEMGEFPKWRSLWPDAEAATDLGRVGLGAKHAAKFAKVYSHGALVKLPTLALTFFGLNKPVVVDVLEVDGMRALWMQVRLAANVE